jgi:hypothetical protein
MTRHAIDEALLAAAGHGAVTVGARRVHLQNPYATTKTSLLNAVATANRCKVIYFDRLAIATIVGVPLDIDQVEMLFVSLLVQATRAMTEAGAGQAGSFDRSARFHRSFLAAYAVRIGERLTESTFTATRSYGNELVPLLKRQDGRRERRVRASLPLHSAGQRSIPRSSWLGCWPASCGPRSLRCRPALRLGRLFCRTAQDSELCEDAPTERITHYQKLVPD